MLQKTDRGGEVRLSTGPLLVKCVVGYVDERMLLQLVTKHLHRCIIFTQGRSAPRKKKPLLKIQKQLLDIGEDNLAHSDSASPCALVLPALRYCICRKSMLDNCNCIAALPPINSSPSEGCSPGLQHPIRGQGGSLWNDNSK